MKKIFIFSIMCLFAVFANAQGWTSDFHEADELKGQKAYTCYSFTNETGMFVFFSDPDDLFKIATFDGFFDYGRYHTTHVIIGLYDEDDKLIDKIDYWIYVQKDNSSIAFDNGKKPKKVINYLKQNKGYIRIIADRYGKSSFDFKVPCLDTHNVSE